MKEFGFAMSLSSLVLSASLFNHAYESNELLPALFWMALIFLNSWSVGVGIRNLSNKEG